MGQNRAQLDSGANMVFAANPGDITLSQKLLNGNATVGAANLSAPEVLGGILRRTGSTANYADVFPSAESILRACPVLGPGDSFEFTLINTVAFTNTPTGGTGIVMGNNTAQAVSSVRDYLFQVLGNGFTQVASASTVNGSPVITNISAAQIANINIGQGISGTGIPGGATVIGTNLSTGTVTMSANASATGDVVAVTTFPRIRVDGIRSSSL